MISNLNINYQSPRHTAHLRPQALFPQMLGSFMNLMSDFLGNMAPSHQTLQSTGNPNFGVHHQHPGEQPRPNFSHFLGSESSLSSARPFHENSHRQNFPRPFSNNFPKPGFRRPVQHFQTSYRFLGPSSTHRNLATSSFSPGRKAVHSARQFIGQRSWDIKGKMPNFRRVGGLGRNCADFVSAALQNGGMLGKHEVNVTKLEKQLIKEGWVKVPNAQAGPGDVAITRSRSHVELCQGNGKTIGSNNSDKKQPGVQFITERKLKRGMIVYRKVS